MNMMDYGVPLGRRFRALKLWFVMRYYGREGLADMIRAHVAWAQELAALIDADPDFERCAPAPFSAVCFRYRGIGEKQSRSAGTGECIGRGFSFAVRACAGGSCCAWQSAIWEPRAPTCMRAWELVKESAAGLERATDPLRLRRR